MLIYCAQLSLVAAKPVDALLDVCAEWLRFKTREPITGADLKGAGERDAKDGNRVEWLSATHEGAAWYAARFSHPDRLTAGRSWLTEIGICHTPERFSCSILLRTHELSALVHPSVQTTRPKLVADIVARCAMSAESCGGTVRPLRLADAEAFLSEVNNPDRRHPIVVVSPGIDGKYLMLPERAASQLAGIALVAAIPPGEDTYALEDALSPRFSCYNGAVNIIWPRAGAGSTSFVPKAHIMPHEIAAVRSRGDSPEHHLLATICHRLNDAYSRNHITLEMIRSVKHRAALDEARRTAVKEDPVLAELARVVDEEQRTQIVGLRSQLSERDAKIEELEGRLSDAENAAEALKLSLAATGGRSATTAAPSLTDDGKAIVSRAVSKDGKLFDCLKVIELLFPDRVVILDSAWKSARDAEGYDNPRRAFDLLHTLCDEYWGALAAGKSDKEAGSALGTAFSAKESETVEKNKKARALRTFVYKGKSTEMMMHLKIGTKPSPYETFRAHFEWDPDEKRIVIGHCGKHLDHK